jgi:signal transduction histidine kinase
MANDADRSDKAWLNRLAHDLRNPLTSLQTAAYLLRTDPGGVNARELADIVVRQSQRMARMVDELDDWARAEQRRLVDRSERVELGGVIDMAVGSVHGSTIDPQYGNGTEHAVVLGDSGRLSQLFRTLVEQIVARDAQGARVDVSRSDDTALVVFSDHGPALDDDARARLLTAPQVPAPDDGLGLRLLIAKAIVEAHAGTLAVEGPNESTTQRFRCTLPLA